MNGRVVQPRLGQRAQFYDLDAHGSVRWRPVAARAAKFDSLSHRAPLGFAPDVCRRPEAGLAVA